MAGINFENAQVGYEFPEYRFKIDGDLVKRYCEAVEDSNPLYVDEEFAKKSEFEGLVTPPLMMNVYAHFLRQLAAAGFTHEYTIHYMSDYEFITPAKPGDTLISKMWLVDKYTRKGRNYMTFRIETYNQNGEKIANKLHTSAWSK